jgi:quercetin dioxygenase-like cupin family protein
MSSSSNLNLTAPLRRIILGHDEKGTALFTSDDTLHSVDPTTAPAFNAPKPDSAFGVIQIHRSRSFPVDNTLPIKEPHRTLVPLADTKGPSARVLDLMPAESGWMHRTLSLDYVVVMKGTVAVRTDGGAETVVKEGDVLVVRGANHEYVNRGTDVARLFAVVVPSREIEIGGEKLVKTEAGEVFDPPEED